MKLQLQIMEGRFSICQTEAGAAIPWEDPICFFCKTEEERSLVCLTRSVPKETIQQEDGWRMLRFAGPLSFSLVGVLSRLTACLAKNGISIFAVSTFDTDYILLREVQLEKALSVLSTEYEII
jgi:hypothetical protein